MTSNGIIRYYKIINMFNYKKKVMTNTKIPGLSFSFKRAVGITAAKRAFTKATGIPTTKTGIERKIGAAIIGMIFGKKK